MKIGKRGKKKKKGGGVCDFVKRVSLSLLRSFAEIAAKGTVPTGQPQDGALIGQMKSKKFFFFF